MDLWVKITKARNGYIVENEEEYSYTEPEDTDKTFIEREVVEVRDDIIPHCDKTESFVEALAARNLIWRILEKLGYQGSKYGYKIEINIMDEDWKVIEDPDQHNPSAYEDEKKKKEEK